MAAGGYRGALPASKTGPSAHYESKPSDKTRAQSWLVLFSFFILPPELSLDANYFISSTDDSSINRKKVLRVNL